MPSRGVRQAVMVCLIVIILIAVVYAIKQGKPDASKGTAEQESAISVESMPVTTQDFQVAIDTFGTLLAAERHEIHSLISGQIVYLSPNFKNGALVKKGEPLVKLDTNDFELAVAQAQSELAQSELALAEENARAGQAKRDWNSRKNKGQAKEFTLRVPHVKAAKARVVQAKALVKQAKLNLERTVISAQFTGRLQATNAELGTVINQNILLAEGFSAQDGEIRLPISINDLPFVSGVLTPNRYRDMAIELSNPLTRPAETWQATLERVEAQIDQQSQQAFIVARINNAFLASENDQKNPLQLGQYLKAKLMGDMLEDAIVLPNNLIYQGSYVYLVERSDKSRLKRQAVTVLYRGETESVIASGLEVGQEVVTTALGQLTSGTLITIQAPSAEVNTP